MIIVHFFMFLIFYVTITLVCLISISSVMTLVSKGNRSKAFDSGAETKSIENHTDEPEQSSSGDDEERTVTDGTVGINDFIIRVDSKDMNK